MKKEVIIDVKRKKEKNIFFLLHKYGLTVILEVLHYFKLNSKRRLKDWVVITLLLLPIVLVIIQLFFIGSNIKKISNDSKTVVVESRCYCD